MKRLAVFSGIVLVLNLVWGYAYALSFRFDLGGDGNFDNPAEITIAESATVKVDIWLVGWNEADAVSGIDYYFTYTAESLDVVSVSCNNLKAAGGQFDDEYYHPDYPEAGRYALGVVEYSKGVPGPAILLHRITVKCTNGSRDGFISVSLGDDGIVLDVKGTEYVTAVDAQGTIRQREGTVTTTTVIPDYTTTTAPVVSTSSSTTTTTSPGICFVETLYGEDSQETVYLRSVRDLVVSTFPAAHDIADFYYALSPAIVNLMAADEGLERELKSLVDQFIEVTRNLPVSE